MNINKNKTQLNITRGNDITLVVTLQRDGDIFPTHLADDIKVSILSRLGYRQNLTFQLDVDKLVVDIPAKVIMTNVYGLLIEGTLGGSQWRTFYESLLRYTDFTEALVTDTVQQTGDSFDLTLEVQLYKGLNEAIIEEVQQAVSDVHEAIGELDSKVAEHNEDETAHAPLFAAMRKSIEDGMCVAISWSDLKALRDNGELLPGRFYRITDYVTTTTQANTRSQGHPFDIIVRADSPSVLNEQACAIQHDGDDYFKDSRLEAWELRYRLDNVQWSKQIGTFVTDEENGYLFKLIGDITLSGHTYKLLQGLGAYVDDWSDYALMETVAEGEQIICYYGDPEKFDPEEPEVTGTASGVEEVTVPGTGTIVWMKDEFGNECPYDFKNIQFKRWKASDDVGHLEALDGKYMIADPQNCPSKLIVEDQDDFIWAFTFSSESAGGEQTDYSLGGHEVHHNHFSENMDGSIPNNVFYGENNYHNKFGFDCYNNSWGNGCQYNSWGNNCYSNSWGNSCQNNSWGNNCFNNSWGNSCYYNSWGNLCTSNSWGNGCSSNSWGNNCYSNSWGNSCYNNSWGNGCNNNSWGNDCYRNSWGNGCQNNSWGNSCRNNSWGNQCTSNSWGNEITQSTVFDGVQYTQITTAKVQNIQVLNGLAGTSSSKVSLNFAANKSFTQVATKTSAGALKIYVPGDLS